MSAFRLAGFVFVCMVSISQTAVADLLVGKFGGEFSSPVTRFRESDGANLGTAGDFQAETNQGMTLGPDGMLYIVGNSLGFGSIEKNNPVTGQYFGEVYQAFPNPSDPFANQFRGPNSLIFGHDGNIYSTASQTQGGGVTGVVRFTAAAAFQGVVIAPGDNGLGTPNNLWRMPGGDLLVTDGARINRYNKDTLAFVSTFIAPGSGGIGVAFFSSTFGPDGDFYTVDNADDRVLRYDGGTGAFLDVFATFGGDFRGITFGNNGDFYAITSVGGNRISRFNGTNGAFINTFVPPPGTDMNTAFYLLTAPDLPEPASVGAIVGFTLMVTMRRRVRV